MFYEGMIDELSTLNDTNSNVSDGFSEDDIGKRKNIGVMDRDKNQVALNDDSDLDMEGDNDNDGNIVGDSGSDKGEAMWMILMNIKSINNLSSSTQNKFLQ